MKLALKIDVDTYRGTLEGVPRLVELLRKHDAQATFLFSLGPDHTGRAIKRVFRRGFLKKVSRTSVTSHTCNLRESTFTARKRPSGLRANGSMPAGSGSKGSSVRASNRPALR